MSNADNDPVVEKLMKANTAEMVELRGTISDLRRQVENLADMVSDLRREMRR